MITLITRAKESCGYEKSEKQNKERKWSEGEMGFGALEKDGVKTGWGKETRKDRSIVKSRQAWMINDVGIH